MSRPPLALAFVVALLGTACEGSSGGGGEQVSAEEARALRNEMFAASIPPVRIEPPPVSAELFELGQALFFDKILSGNEDVSCATCHLPQFATGDGRTLSDGVHGFGLGPDRDGGVIIPRNSPPLFGLHLRNELFWDGRVRDVGSFIALPPAVFLSPEMLAAFSPRLEVMAAQAMLPPVSHEEMRGLPGDNDLGDLGDGYGSPNGIPEITELVWEELTVRLLALPGYVNLFRAAYPDVAIQDFNFAHAGNAIAAFEAHAFARTDSPFDRFMRGDDTALTPAEMRGARAFLEAGCASCHKGPLLSDLHYHNTGLPQLGPGLNGPDATPAIFGRPDFGRENTTRFPDDRYKFRTASLLNVELTAPYGHAGQFERLRDFVAHYQDAHLSNLNYDIQSNVSDPALVLMLVPNSDEVLATLDPRLQTPNDFDVDAVVEFLHTLTADDAYTLSDIVPASVPSSLPIF